MFSQAPAKLAVTGAGGFIGRSTVWEGIRRGFGVVAIIRPGSSHRPTQGTVVEADVLDRQRLAMAFEGCGAVIHLAAVTSSAGRPNDSYRVNVAGSHSVAVAAREAGITRFVYLASQAANEGTYAITKRKGEAAIRATGIQPIVLRPSLVYGPGDQGIFARIVKFVRILPIVPLIGDGRYPMRPIHVEDVAAAIFGAVELGIAGTVYDICGGSEILFRDLLVAIGREVGRQPSFVRIPRGPISAASKLATRIFADFPVTPDMIRGLTSPVVLEGGPAERALGFRARSLEEGLRSALR